jgi:hypothetical protein
LQTNIEAIRIAFTVPFMTGVSGVQAASFADSAATLTAIAGFIFSRKTIRKFMRILWK